MGLDCWACISMSKIKNNDEVLKMKKILLATVCAFVLSQNSFAGTSFADLIELEKASFMPQIEIQSTETEPTRTKTIEIIREEISTTGSFTSKNDESSGWNFVSSVLDDTDEQYEEFLTKEELIPNTALAKGDVCKMWKKLWYDTKKTIAEFYLDTHEKISCFGIVLNGETWYQCDSKTKETLKKSTEVFWDVRIDLECDEYYATASFVKAD